MRRIALAGLALAGFASATAAAADALVLEATGPSARRYPVGQRLADDARIALRPGDTIYFIWQDRVRRLRGPGTFTPAHHARPVRSRLRTGAVHSVSQPPVLPPDVWMVDVTATTTACVRRRRPLVLWRDDTRRSAGIVVEEAGRPVQTRDWPAGGATLAVPHRFRPDVETHLRITGAWDRRVAVTLLPARLDGIRAVAEALVAGQCRAQLRTFIHMNLDPGSGPIP